MYTMYFLSDAISYCPYYYVRCSMKTKAFKSLISLLFDGCQQQMAEIRD